MVCACCESERNPANTIMQDRVEGKRSRGRPTRQWLGDVKEWIVLERDVE